MGYSQKYNSIARVTSKKAGLAHGDSVALQVASDPGKEARKKEIKGKLEALQKKKEKRKHWAEIKETVGALKEKKAAKEKAKAEEALRQRYITSAKEEAYHRAWEERKMKKKYGNK